MQKSSFQFETELCPLRINTYVRLTRRNTGVGQKDQVFGGKNHPETRKDQPGHTTVSPITVFSIQKGWVIVTRTQIPKGPLLSHLGE